MSIPLVNKAVEHLINSTPVLGEERERENSTKKNTLQGREDGGERGKERELENF